MNKNNLGTTLLKIFGLLIVILFITHGFDIYLTLLQSGFIVFWLLRFLPEFVLAPTRSLGLDGIAILANILQALLLYYGGNYVQKISQARKKD